jgi:hypothetical protein
LDSSLKIDFSNKEKYFLEWGPIRFGKKMMPNKCHFIVSKCGP